MEAVSIRAYWGTMDALIGIGARRVRRRYALGFHAFVSVEPAVQTSLYCLSVPF